MCVCARSKHVICKYLACICVLAFVFLKPHGAGGGAEGKGLGCTACVTVRTGIKPACNYNQPFGKRSTAATNEPSLEPALRFHPTRPSRMDTQPVTSTRICRPTSSHRCHFFFPYISPAESGLHAAFHPRGRNPV